MTEGWQNVDEYDDVPLSFKGREIQRGTEQVLHADGFIDLRNIMAIRRAFQLPVPLRHLESGQNGAISPPQPNNPHERQEEDESDEGGDEILARHPNKPYFKMRRSFELLMRTGHVIRFEVCTPFIPVQPHSPWIQSSIGLFV